MVLLQRWCETNRSRNFRFRNIHYLFRLKKYSNLRSSEIVDTSYPYLIISTTRRRRSIMPYHTDISVFWWHVPALQHSHMSRLPACFRLSPDVTRYHIVQLHTLWSPYISLYLHTILIIAFFHCKNRCVYVDCICNNAAENGKFHSDIFLDMQLLGIIYPF